MKPTPWTLLNQRYLYQAVGGVRQLLSAIQKSAQTAESLEATRKPQKHALPQPDWPVEQPPPALTTLCQIFNLSNFERGILLLCAAIEIDPSLAQHYAAIQSAPPRPYPTLHLALRYLAEAHWDALTPAAPLRHWQLVELVGDEPLTTQAIKIDERILHYLMGVAYLDPLLERHAVPVAIPFALPPSQQALADRLVKAWQQGSPSSVNLYGGVRSSREAIAATACSQIQGRLYALEMETLPVESEARSHFQRRWEREAALGNHSLLINASTASTPEKAALLQSFIQRQQGRIIVSSEDPLPLPPSTRQQTNQPLRLEVASPSTAEQMLLWQRSLGALSNSEPLELGPIVSQFGLEPEGIFQVGERIRAQAMGDHLPEGELEREPEGEPERELEERLAERLWQACRQQARTTLDDLAQRLNPTATWEDLVLPEPQLRTLQAIVASVQQRSQVYETWGFSQKSNRGLGISALFAGSSGTGKTLSAEVLAQALKLDLYRIDLSAVVSKYIGETEKNLRRIFDAAEQGGVILLFDEADALFGKRSEVKDSHDRHANIEVSYLLQRMETYRGLAILTTNFKRAIDPAFLRRIRFVVSFPFPDMAQRQEIWRRIFPTQTPTSGLAPNKLAQLTVPGGNIYSIAMNAAFLASAEASPVRMQHVLQAAQSEYTKLDKKLADAEVRGWI